MNNSLRIASQKKSRDMVCDRVIIIEDKCRMSTQTIFQRKWKELRQRRFSKISTKNFKSVYTAIMRCKGYICTVWRRDSALLSLIKHIFRPHRLSFPESNDFLLHLMLYRQLSRGNHQQIAVPFYLRHYHYYCHSFHVA